MCVHVGVSAFLRACAHGVYVCASACGAACACAPACECVRARTRTRACEWVSGWGLRMCVCACLHGACVCACVRVSVGPHARVHVPACVPGCVHVRARVPCALEAFLRGQAGPDAGAAHQAGVTEVKTQGVGSSLTSSGVALSGEYHPIPNPSPFRLP